MRLPFFPPAQNIADGPSQEFSDERPPVVIREQSQNTSEGSEFLDDALRTEDLFLPRTEESVAAGTPGHLLL
ncbi:hypothetical protein [Puia sp.]|jgi:hypothetical protein|uniref:hypothetical protein n=1 Tax=Puia sp. TaxID=2045100 RepID=UPI002F402320